MNTSKSSGQTPALKKQRVEKSKTKSLKNKKMIFFVPIKVRQGKPYADVLGKLRKEVNPDASGSTVIRITQKGDVLILMDKESNKEGFTAEVKRVVEGLGKVRVDPKKVTLEIPDLDPLETKEEVKVELRKALLIEQTNPDVKVLNQN